MKRSVGRPRVYPFFEMRVGDHYDFTVFSKAHAASIRSAARYAGEQMDVQFSTRLRSGVLTTTRIK